MPTYEYRCEKGHRFEREQRITDSPLTVCPVQHNPGNTCAISLCSAPCKRLISRSSFILKGSGWAGDGYSNSPGKKKKKPKKKKE